MLNDELLSPESTQPSKSMSSMGRDHDDSINIAFSKLSHSPKSVIIHYSMEGDEDTYIPTGDRLATPQTSQSVSRESSHDSDYKPTPMSAMPLPKSQISQGLSIHDNEYKPPQMSAMSLPKSQANLFREKTDTKWKKEHIERMEEEMKKHMESMTMDSNPTSTVLSVPQSNLYREKTNTVWDSSDIEDLEEEMKMQLESMTKAQKEATDSDSIDNTDTLKLRNRDSNLVQTVSCDWDSEELEREEDQMKTQINHLRSTSKDINM